MTGFELLTAAHHGSAVAVFVLRSGSTAMARPETSRENVAMVTGQGRPVVVDAIDYSRKTYFAAGVVRTNLLRLPWRDRLRFLGRAVGRRVLG